MRQRTATVFAGLLALAGAAAVTGCKDEPDSFEDVGEQMDEAAEEAGDALEDAADEIEDTVDRKGS